jgi:two-component system sensor histidine kinase UhpB
MPYITKPLNLLVIEDNDGDFVLFTAYLQQTNLTIHELYRATALSRIPQGTFDIVFLDLSLPDSGGVESFTYLNQLLPEVPIVVLTGNNNEALAMECIRLGAQDYLVKDDLNEKLLEKSIHYSIERKKNLEKIRNTNRQYELISSITNDVIWSLDLDSKEITTNREIFFGYKEGATKHSIDWCIEKIHPEDRKRVIGAIQRVLKKEATSMQEEYRVRCADGEYCHVFTRARLLPEDKSESSLLIGAMMDITASKKLQEDLVRTQLEAQKQIAEASLLAQEKLMEELGKELHDNINQILASVKLYLETAQRDEDLREMLIAKGRENTMYALDEIRKLSHSLMSPAFENYGLKDAVRTLVDELNLTGLFSISLLMDDWNESALDNRKKTMLYRIIQEQVNNIIKYAKATEIKIALEWCGSAVKLMIADNGIGFETSTKSKGIGLRNIESRVSYYSGKMQLLSAPGKGTSLEVYLPC